MGQFEVISSNEGLYDIEGGSPVVIPIIKGLLKVGTFCFSAVRMSVQMYESAKDDAEQAGRRDAYIDLMQ